MTEKERRFYDSVVDGLRRAGWGRIEAESEAEDRIERIRERSKNGEAHGKTAR